MSYIYDLTDTWNAGGTTFNAIKMNVTDSASAVTSKLVSLQTNGTEHFSVTKAGVGYFSGNLGIGTSSPATKLDVNGAATVSGIFYSTAFINTSNGTSYFTDASTGNGIYVGGSTATPANTVRFFTNSAERIRIDGTGKLQINTTSTAGGYFTLNTLAQSGLDIYRSDSTANYTGIRFRDATNANTYGQLGWDSSGLRLDGVAGTMYFSTSGTERARIDSSGNLLVGTTALPSGSGTSGVSIRNVSGVIGQIIIGKTQSGTVDAQTFYYSGTYVGGIQISNTATSLITSSDVRLKDYITDADDAASLIDAIQVRKFDWKADGSHQRYGFVAQELVTVAPEAVSQPADPDDMMGVDYSKLVPMLVKEIQSLRARVAQLEGN